jgi:hypothetical protein
VGFDAGRLRRGELVAGGGGIVLSLALFLLPWFSFGASVGTAAARSPAASLDGWHSLTGIRWILLITIAVSLAVVVLTATRRSPAVPVTFSMLTVLLGGLSSLLVLYRIIDHPGAGSALAPVTAKPGLYVGLIAAAVIAYGGYLSMHTEGSTFGDPASVETVPIGRTVPGSEGREERDEMGRVNPDSGSPTESSSAGRPGRDPERA